MAKLLYSGTHGTDDPTLASLPFIAANGAKEAGHEPLIVLFGEATHLMRSGTEGGVQGVGFPPLKDVLATTIANGTPIYV